MGKATWFNTIDTTEDDSIGALFEITEEQYVQYERFVGAAHCTKGTSIPELRWNMFYKYMTESEKLPPTISPSKKSTSSGSMCRLRCGNRQASRINFSVMLCKAAPTDDNNHLVSLEIHGRKWVKVVFEKTEFESLHTSYTKKINILNKQM